MAAAVDDAAMVNASEQAPADDDAAIEIKLCHETGNFMTALALPGQGFVQPVAELRSLPPGQREGERVCKPLFSVATVHRHLWDYKNKDESQTDKRGRDQQSQNRSRNWKSSLCSPPFSEPP